MKGYGNTRASFSGELAPISIRNPKLMQGKENMKNKASFNVGGFLVGIGVGLGAALLFAPSSGAELRDNIASKSHDLGESARQGVEAIQKGFRRGVEEGSATGTEYR